MTDLLNPNWTKRVRAGDFAAIPEHIDFGGSVELAMMIDGYGVGGGVPACCAIRDRVLTESQRQACHSASALDLWIALFTAHRAYRHAGTWPQGDDRRALDMLVARLRAALLKLTPQQKAGIMAAMDGAPYWSGAGDGHD